MNQNKTLFDNDYSISHYPTITKGEREGIQKGQRESDKKEVTPLERLKNLEDKIAEAIEKVRTLKEEKAVLERRIKELESKLDDKNHEIEMLKSEKIAIKSQVEGLLNELDLLEVV